MAKQLSLQNMFNKITKYGLLFLAVSGLQVSKAHAASSDWQDLGGGKARIIANLDPITNKVSGVVEVELKEGWSTYWRYPGSSGIPPRFDFTKSKAFSFQQVKFPAPKLINPDHETRTYAGYKSKVLFPFDAEMLATSGGKINLDILIGLCEQICIPAKAEMEIHASELFQSDPKAVQTINFAKIHVPKEKDAKDVILDVNLADDKKLYIKTKHKKSFGKPSLFVEGPNDWYLLPAKLMQEEDEHALFALDVSQAPEGTNILAHKLKYTLTRGSSGIEIIR